MVAFCSWRSLITQSPVMAARARISTSLALLFAVIIVFTFMLIASDKAFATASTEGTQTVDPATVQWAKKWVRIAGRERASLVRHCTILGKQLPGPLPVLLGEDWQSYGAACKVKSQVWHERKDQLHFRMTHPGGSGAARWWPLAWIVGWPTSQKATLIKVIWRESNGNPRCYTPPYGAAGLMQFLSAWYTGRWSLPAFDPYDPETNLKMGLRLWKQQGWRPWSLTAY